MEAFLLQFYSFRAADGFFFTQMKKQQRQQKPAK